VDYPVEFTVYGTPGPQGSKKDVGTRIAKSGRPTAILVESSKKVKPWRRRVAAAAGEHRPAEVLDGPLAAYVVFTLARPKAHYGTGRNAGVLKARYVEAQHFRMPDLSKLIRSTEDALKGVIWADDGRVCLYDRLAKVYVDSGDPDALDEPGAVIRVRPLAVDSQYTPHMEGLFDDVVQGG
jgi:Holliday junction resolvase RusA-like endonuclease